MKYIKGDLITLAKQGEFDIIVHGCNCFNAMGKGIALSIKNNFPEAYSADCKTIKGDRYKLGTYTSARIERKDGSSFTVINAYTQYTYWDRGIPVLFEYDAFQEVLDLLKGTDTVFNAIGETKRWGFPLIGCGLAGGDKEIVLNMIATSLEGRDVTVVEFEG